MTRFNRRNNHGTKRQGQRELAIESLEARTLLAADAGFAHSFAASDIVVEKMGAAEIGALTGNTTAESGDPVNPEEDPNDLRDPRDVSFFERIERPASQGTPALPGRKTADELAATFGITGTTILDDADGRPGGEGGRGLGDRLSPGGSLLGSGVDEGMRAFFRLRDPMKNPFEAEREVEATTMADILKRNRPDTSGMVDPRLMDGGDDDDESWWDWLTKEGNNVGEGSGGQESEPSNSDPSVVDDDTPVFDDGPTVDEVVAGSLEGTFEDPRNGGGRTREIVISKDLETVYVRTTYKFDKDVSRIQAFTVGQKVRTGVYGPDGHPLKTPKPDGDFDFETAVATRNWLDQMKGILKDFSLQDNETPVYRRFKVTAPAVDDAIANWGPDGKTTAPVIVEDLETLQTLSRNGRASPIRPPNPNGV